jgi:aerobic carbon-monoxide dehydrogenase large subunit
MPCSAERVWRATKDAREGIFQALWTEPPEVFATLPLRGATGSPEAEGADI